MQRVYCFKMHIFCEFIVLILLQTITFSAAKIPGIGSSTSHKIKGSEFHQSVAHESHPDSASTKRSSQFLVTEFIKAISKFEELRSCIWISLEDDDELTVPANGELQRIAISLEHTRVQTDYNYNPTRNQISKYSRFCTVVLTATVTRTNLLLNLELLANAYSPSLISNKNYHNSFIFIFDLPSKSIYKSNNNNLESDSNNSTLKSVPHKQNKITKDIFNDFVNHPFKIMIRMKDETENDNDYASQFDFDLKTIQSKNEKYCQGQPIPKLLLSRNQKIPQSIKEIFPKSLTENGQGKELQVGPHLRESDCDFITSNSKRRPEDRQIIKEFLPVAEIILRRNFTCKVVGEVGSGSKNNLDLFIIVPMFAHYYKTLDISPQLIQDYIGFCYLKGLPVFSPKNIYKPLTFNVWACFCLSWLSCSLTFALITHTIKLDVSNSNQIKIVNAKSKIRIISLRITRVVLSWLWLTFRSTLLQGMPIRKLLIQNSAPSPSKPIERNCNSINNLQTEEQKQDEPKSRHKTEALKLFAGLWFLFSILMNVSYTSNLISILTSPADTQDSPKNFQDLIDFNWNYGSPHLLLLKKVDLKNDSFNQIMQNAEQIQSEKECVERATRSEDSSKSYSPDPSKYACLGLIHHLQHLANIAILNLSNADRFTTIINYTMPSVRVGLGWRWCSPFRKSFRFIVEGLVEAGFPKLWSDQEEQSELPSKIHGMMVATKESSRVWGKTKTSAKVLRLSHLQGSFIAMCFGLFVASLIFLLETCKTVVLLVKTKARRFRQIRRYKHT